MYIGNDLQIAHPSYKIIDDISSGFNGSTTSFALQVNGATPVPFPISTQQVMISVNGVVQEPDPTGSAGFKLLGSNIVFSSAPANGHAFFGVINAGADYVTAGSEFPDGSATAPSFTFQDDQDTGWFRSGSGAVGYSANGAQTLTFDGNGLTVTGDASFVGDSSKNLLWDKSAGALEFADNAKAVFGASSDLQIFHDGSDSYIKEAGVGNVIHRVTDGNIEFKKGASEYLAKFIPDGAIELYHDNSKKLNTFANGVTVTGTLYASDGIYVDDSSDSGSSNYIAVGAGKDLKLWHDGSQSIINDTSGELQVRSDQIKLMTASGKNEYYLIGNEDGAVELYYDNAKIFETLSYGVRVKRPSGGATDFIVEACEGQDAHIQLKADDGDDNPDIWRLRASIYGSGHYQYYNGSGWSDSIKAVNAGTVELYHNNVKKVETTSAGVTVTGTVSDSKGNLRSIPNDTKTSAYTLVASDAGKCIRITTGGVTVPNSVFAEGEAVTIINQSGSDQTITAGSGFTLYNSGDGSAGSKTLAGRGMVTLMFTASDAAYMSGAGLS